MVSLNGSYTSHHYNEDDQERKLIKEEGIERNRSRKSKENLQRSINQRRNMHLKFHLRYGVNLQSDSAASGQRRKRKETRTITEGRKVTVNGICLKREC